MLSTEPPQHLRHSCSPEEFKQYLEGTKTFDVKLNDGVFNLQEDDIITFEERDPETGELTGRKETKRVGAVLSTVDIANVTNDEVAQKGLSIFSLVQQTHRTLYSLYDRYFTVSVAIDRRDDQELEEDPKWTVLGMPSLTPTITCPDFVEGGILEALNLNNWPVGRYSVTLLISIDLDKKEPPHDVQILDIIVIVMTAAEEDPEDLEFTELNSEILEGGTALSLKTGSKVTPLHPDEVDVRLTREMSREELDGYPYPDMVTTEELQNLIREAEARGEDVEAVKNAFFVEDDGAADEEDEEEDYDG
jgi:hypothetical protein